MHCQPIEQLCSSSFAFHFTVYFRLFGFLSSSMLPALTFYVSCKCVCVCVGVLSFTRDKWAAEIAQRFNESKNIRFLVVCPQRMGASVSACTCAMQIRLQWKDESRFACASYIDWMVFYALWSALGSTPCSWHKLYFISLNKYTPIEWLCRRTHTHTLTCVLNATNNFYMKDTSLTPFCILVFQCKHTQTHFALLFQLTQFDAYYQCILTHMWIRVLVVTRCSFFFFSFRTEKPVQMLHDSLCDVGCYSINGFLFYSFSIVRTLLLCCAVSIHTTMLSPK